MNLRMCLDFVSYPLHGLSDDESKNTIIELFLNDRKHFETVLGQYPYLTASALKILKEEDSNNVISDDIDKFVDSIPPSERLKKKMKNCNLAYTAIALSGLASLVYSLFDNNQLAFAASVGTLLPINYAGNKINDLNSKYIFKKELESI